MRNVRPSPLLAPFVRAFTVVEVRDPTTRVRLPEAGLVLGVRFRGSAGVLDGATEKRLPDATLAGMTLTARRMSTSAGGGVVLARFHPGGAAAFFPEPLHALFGTTAPLDGVVPPEEVGRLVARVAEADCDRARVAALEAFLLARMQPRPADPLVAAAVRAISDAHGAVSIRALARQLGTSQDPLEKRFRRSVGASPKQLASLLRLRHAIEAYRSGKPMGQLALEAGFYDQSHFTRAFRTVTGEAPGRFLRTGGDL